MPVVGVETPPLVADVKKNTGDKRRFRPPDLSTVPLASANTRRPLAACNPHEPGGIPHS
jgi:hypothetical protein